MPHSGVLERGLRLAVGPIALAGFFLPWAHGPGLLAASEFTGFRLVGAAGRFQALEIEGSTGMLLPVLRFGVLGVAIAALWQVLLAPAHRWHVGYRLSGWYLIIAASASITVGIARSGLGRPPAGLALVVIAAALFATCEAAGRGVPQWPPETRPRE